MNTSNLNFKSLFPDLSGFSLFKATSSELFTFPKELKSELTEAALSITNQLFSPSTLSLAEKNITTHSNILDFRKYQQLPQPYFMTIDLAYAPGGVTNFKLIEAQAFPSISHMFFEYYLKLLQFDRDVFLNIQAYQDFLRKITGSHSILLEDQPWEQKTAIDFHLLQKQALIEVVNFRDIRDREILKEKLIYNRLIFADLTAQEFNQAKTTLSGLPSAAWLHHPDWYYFVSKASLPYIRSPWCAQSFLVADKPLNFEPKNNAWVLKPLFDYGCSGVNLNPSQEDIDNVTAPKEWLLQQKIELKHLPGTELFGEIRVVLFNTNKGWEPIVFFARINDKPFLGSQHFNLSNPKCGAAAIEFVK